jgi:hypothetical protein
VLLCWIDREWGDDPEGRVKIEGASQEYEFSSEESEGEENNREVEHDPLDSRSPEGRVKHSLLKSPMAPQWKHPSLSPFLEDGLSDCALYLSIRFLFTSSIMAAI